MDLTKPSDNKPTDEAVVAFLADYHRRAPEGLEVLSGGFWSAAYGYRIGHEELVLRIGDDDHGFRADQRAMRYGSARLPVPDVIDIGQAFGRWFAVSRRHRGRFLEDIGPDEGGALGPTVVGLLTALRSVPEADVPARPWREWLTDGISDRPGRRDSGWRSKLSHHGDIERTFIAVERRIRARLDACPDRRQLVHSDLLHYNVLVAPAADAVTAVFSWKCSTWGDALYDLAWCTFRGRWHRGIGALGLWDLVAPTLRAADAVDASERHHVYELQIGASHLAWYLTVGDNDMLRWTAHQLDHLLDAGPRKYT